MILLNGSGLGWTSDQFAYCAANPTDPKCGSGTASGGLTVTGGGSPIFATFSTGGVKTTTVAVPGASTTSTVPAAGAQTTAATAVPLIASTPWYRTWWGMGVLALVAFGAYRYLNK